MGDGASDPKESSAPTAAANPPAKKAKKKRPIWWRVVRGLLFTLLALVAIAASAVLWLHSDSGKSFVRKKVVARLSERVDGTVEIGSLDYALFGDLHLGDVHIKDSTGREAIALESLDVKPNWDELRGRSSITLDEVALKGLHLHIVKAADGSSNLSTLFKKKAEEAPAEPRKPIDKPIEVKKLSISDVDVEIENAEGTKIAVADLQIEGHVRALPASKDVELTLDPIALGFSLKKPEDKGGLSLGIEHLKTGLAVSLVGGKGQAKLLPLSGDLALDVPGKVKRSFPIAWSGITLDIGDGNLGVALDKLAADAVSLAQVEFKTKLGDGGLAGAPAGDIVGLHLDASKVNGLAGKPILKSDLDLEAHLAGDEAHPTLAATVNTRGGQVKVDAKLDTRDADNPVHDVAVTLTDIDTDALLDPALAIPSIKVASLKLTAKGHGKTAESVDTAATLAVRGVSARGIPIDDVDASVKIAGDKITIDALDVAALEQRIHAAGTFDRGTKELDLTLGLNGDVGAAIEKLKAAGLPLESKLKKGMVRLPDGDLTLHVTGAVGGDLSVTAKADQLALLGGKAKLDAKLGLEKGDPEKGEKKVKLKTFDVDLDVGGLSLGTIMGTLGKPWPPALKPANPGDSPRRVEIDAAIGARVRAHGTPVDPKVNVDVSVVTSRKDGGKRLALDLVADVTKTAAHLDITAHDKDERGDVVLKVDGDVPLLLEGETKGLDPNRPLNLNVAIPRRSLASLLSFVPLPLPPPPGEVELSVDLHGTKDRPTANAHLELIGALLDPNQPALKQKLLVDAKLAPKDARSAAHKLDVDLSAFVDASGPPILSGKIGADMAASPLAGGAKGAKLAAHLDIGPTMLGSLPAVEKLAKARALGGLLTGSIDVAGTRDDLTADVKLDAKGLLQSQPAQDVGAAAVQALTGGPKGPVDAHVAIHLGHEKTDVDVGADLGGAPLVKLAGTVGVGGKGLLDRLKQGLDPSLDLELSLPERSLASLALLRPNLKERPGKVSGSVKLTGSAKKPMAEGAIALADVAMWSGQPGGAAVALKLDDKEISAQIGLGKPAAGASPVTLNTHIAREPLFAFIKGPDANLDLDLAARAAKVDIKELVPMFAVEGKKLDPKGALDWNMDVHLELEKKEGKAALKDGKLSGSLDLTGVIPIPGTKRVYKDAKIALKADAGGLVIDGIELHESDPQVKDRWLKISGRLGLDKLKPTAADLSLKAEKFLVYGTRNLGLPDAPRGALSIEAKAHAELNRPIKVVDVNIDKLDVTFPDRFEKAHQPEDVHVGDVLFVSKDQKVGKLPQPDSVKEKKEKAEKAEKEKEAADALAASGAPPAPETGADITIHLADGARLLQAPIDFTAKGEIAIAVRPSGRTIKGQLVMTKGELQLGGKLHPLRSGTLTFDTAHPTGNIDLKFERKLAPWNLRNISSASSSRSVKVHSFGPLSDRKNVLSGAGSPGALYDILSIHNQGRERFITGPDMPRSETVDYPAQGGLLVLSFISVNLPHLLFLDRVAAWADPNDGPKAYGRIEHYETERYFADGKLRLRTAKQPAGIGRSEAEVEVDYLFKNDPNLVFGLGIAGGTRGGGGPGLVFEWSSDK